jgi:hypothetical protein
VATVESKVTCCPIPCIIHGISTRYSSVLRGLLEIATCGQYLQPWYFASPRSRSTLTHRFTGGLHDATVLQNAREERIVLIDFKFWLGRDVIGMLVEKQSGLPRYPLSEVET